MIDRNAIESQIVRSGYDYWLAKKQLLSDDDLPRRKDLDPLAEIPRLVPHMMLKDVERDPLDFRYRLIGTALRSHMAQDWTGTRLSALSFQSVGSMVWDNNLRVTESGRPLLAKPPYIGPHKDFLFVESIILPLASDGRRVDMLMFFVDFIHRRGARPLRPGS